MMGHHLSSASASPRFVRRVSKVRVEGRMFKVVKSVCGWSVSIRLSVVWAKGVTNVVFITDSILCTPQ